MSVKTSTALVAVANNRCSLARADEFNDESLDDEAVVSGGGDGGTGELNEQDYHVQTMRFNPPASGDSTCATFRKLPSSDDLSSETMYRNQIRKSIRNVLQHKRNSAMAIPIEISHQIGEIFKHIKIFTSSLFTIDFAVFFNNNKKRASSTFVHEIESILRSSTTVQDSDVTAGTNPPAAYSSSDDEERTSCPASSSSARYGRVFDHVAFVRC